MESPRMCRTMGTNSRRMVSVACHTRIVLQVSKRATVVNLLPTRCAFGTLELTKSTLRSKSIVIFIKLGLHPDRTPYYPTDASSSENHEHREGNQRFRSRCTRECGFFFLLREGVDGCLRTPSHPPHHAEPREMIQIYVAYATSVGYWVLVSGDHEKSDDHGTWSRPKAIVRGVPK